MAEQNKRTYDGVYNSLKQISDEEGVDFGLDGMSQEDFRKKYFTGPGNIENLYHRLNKISNEEGIDFGQGSRDEWLSSFGYRRNADGQKGYQTLDGRPVGRRKAPKPQQTPAGGAAFGLPEGMAYSDEVERRHNSPSNVAGSYKDRAQIASEVQSEGLPAYRQGSKKPVQRDASSYGIPYRPDIELTAAQRDEIEQQNGYAAKQVKQMRQQSEKNQRRRNQPVIDTGDENVNRHIIKTQGQWEDELMNGVNDLGRKYVSPMIEKALKKADNDFFGVFEQASRYPQMQGMELAALRRANERVDPDKILQGLQKSLEKTFSNPEMLKDIEERANAAGIPKDEYLKQVVIPSLQDQLVSEFTNSQIAKHMPKNATEYILQGMSNSIGGLLMGAATETEAQRRYKNEAAAMTEEGLNPHYTPGTGAKLAQMGVSFAADAPFFGFYGKVGGNVAKGFAERQIRKLTAKGLSEGAARSIVGTALENSVGQRMKNYIMQHVVSSSITMGGYNATSETARQVRDREFKPGQIIGSTAEGLATGAAFGLTGGAVQALSQPLSGIARIGSKVGGYLVEGETMYTTEELAKMVHGEEGFTNPFEGSAEAMMKLGVMKVSSPGGLSKAAGELFHPIKSNRRQQTGVRFTPEEEAYVRESAEGKSLLDALSQMHPEMATTEVKGKRQLTAEGEQMRQQLAERYDAFMSNTEIPYAVKAKVAGALGGLMPDAAHTPLETGADIIHNADGSVILKTRDKDGNCMQELRFDSFSEADNWREQHEGDFRLNDAVNMWNGASPEARANTIRQLMEEYGVGEEEAVSMIKSALGGSMGTDFSNDQFLYIYDAVRNNAYPADEPNTRRNYWEGQKLTPQERHQAMVEAQQAEDRLTYMDQAFADEIIGAADFPDEKIAELAGREEITGEQLQAAIDYYNKAARFNGMMEKAAQSVDDQVEAANAFVQRNTHKESGSMVEVESDGRGYYLTAGKIELNPDGTLNMQGCGDVMILRDKETGEIQVASPRQIKVTALNDPQRMIAENESMEGLRGQLMEEANNSIILAEGTPEAPQNGDYFTGADGIRYMAIGVPDEQGNVVWSKIALDEKGEPVGEPKDLDIDEYRKAKSDEIDRDSQTIPEEEIVSDIPETVHHEGEIIPVEAAEQPLPQQEEKTPVVEEATVPDAEKGSSSSQTAFPRIPVVNGKTDWESASTEDSRAALTERYGEEKAREMVGRMIANLKQSYDELLKKDVSKMTDMDKLAAYEDELADIKRKMEYWQQVFEERPAVEVVPEEKPAAEQPQSVPELTYNAPELTESVPETPESVPAEQQPVIPQEPTPPAEKPAEPQPPVQPQKPTAEQKIAEGSVKANLGKTFELRHSDGRRTEMRLESISPGGRAVVTQTDYDAQGNRIGEPQRKVYNVTDIGGSIIQGAMKPVLSTEEKLRAAYKGRVGILNVIDVLTDSEQEQMLRAYENGDNEALTALMHEFTETHREDIILNERDKRNANVSQIMEGNSSREDKLRRVRKQYQGYDDAVLALSDEAMQPTTLEEYVADLHSRQPKSGEGPIAYFSYDRDGTKVVGLQDETGHGSKTGGDTKGYAPWLAPKGKGVSLAKYAEQLHEQLPEGIKAQYSDQDVRNAILEVFGGAERPSDITTMVIKRGIIQAEQAARRMEEMWIEGGPSFHRVSIDDNTFAGRLARGKQQTNTEPTEKQKEAGNYKKGHVSFGGYDFVIENPEGSMRRGKDADGNTWEQQMHNTYGYILGKKGKDGDHLDMFINDQADLDTWNGNVYVVDQVNTDGSFDEHKIMYGFNSEAEAREAYLSNYSEGWKGLGRITGVDKDTFDKWLDSSDRKIKEFAEHSIIKDAVKPVETEPQAKAPTPAERDKVLMDTVVDKMKEAGIDVSTDWEEGQRVIDEYNGSRELKPMGTTVKDKMAAFRDEILNHQMDDEQSRIVSVFTGDADHQVLEFQREDGSSVKTEFQQGNDTGVGTKHSLYGHYGTTRGVIEAGDTLLIPDIMRTGERKVNGNRVTYTKKIGAKRFTVLFDRKGKREVFDDFFSSWKIKKKKDPIVGRSSTEGDTPAGVRNRDTDTFSGARSLNTDDSSGAKVQQNPETTKESDEKLKQFKTSDGHAYGFTYKGKIYIDPRIATSETPIHEYGHLWAEMKRQTAPEEWDAIKNVLLNDKLVKPIIDRVKKDYPELAKEGREDDFIEEILTQFSGKRGAERLREIAEQIAAEKGGVFGKAEAVTAMQRLRNVLAKFWAGVAKMMGWKYSNANEIADKMMLDFLEGVNPTEKINEAASDKMSEMRTYHGSSAEFDHFDHTKVGSGEGQAISGYGTYVTTSEGTARYYANVSSERHKKVLQHEGWTLNGEVVRDSSVKRAYDFLKENDGDVDKAIAACEAKIEARKKRSDAFSRLFNDNSYMENALNYLHQEKEKPGTLGYQEQIEEKPDRQLYEVEIPDDTGENYFDLDSKLSKKQKDEIRKRFLSAIGKTDEADYWKKNRDIIDDEWKQVNSKEATGDTARGVMEQFLPQDEVSKIFSDMGYVGHKVKGSDGTTYIVFNESDLKIMDRMKFQRVSNPEPELTPEDKQYWKQWDTAMKKWKERNAIAADVTGPGEQPKINQGESVLDYAKRLVAHKRESALWQTAPKLEDFHQVRDDKAAQDEAHANEKAYPDSESAKRWRVATDLARLRHAMSRQKAYDKATVKAVTDFAQDFMKMGFGDNLGRGEMERLLSSVKNATGAKDIRKQVDNIMNILIDNQLRNLDQQVVKLSSVKELSKTAQGVEKQGRLELKGQRMIQAFRQAREGRMDAEKIRERLGEVAEKMARNDDEAPMWEQEYEGMSIALQYQENIEGSRDEWADLDREYKDAMKEYKQSGRSYKAQQELLESLEQAMMENKIERIGMFGDIIGRLQGNISESMQGAKEFVEREKERMKHIQQIANFDLAGKDMGAMREKIKGKPANFFLQPLATFEQMLRQFGSRNASGEGYLFDHFMRSWMDSTDKAYVNEQKAKEELDAKASEVFGDKVKRWSDLYEIVRSLPTLEVEVLDGEDPKTFTLNQGNLLYIYMADKMTDGRMKLRKMGIDEETVEKVKDFLDPRLVQLGDWLQDDYLVQKRIIYNKVHERMFGAPMAAIDHYFPLKILGDARYQEQDVSNMADQDAVLPSTITGNIIKRRKNALPLDILHTDALSLAIEHVEDMERWAATAEWNKDINTLLSYTTFRNKVKNMSTIYGSGDALWNTFADTARMAAGTYRPKAKPGSVDSAISNIAKGVTAAKINFRVYTAFKQILSAPAFLHDVNIGNFVKNSVNPYGSWKWAMENMPVFEKRWKSRQVGDTRLMDDPTDWKMWKTSLVQMATRMGMSPNALVDGVTCAVGARSIYESRYKKYKSIGASDELAHKRALQDAEIGYNLTQQSSEGAFVSAIQKDRTVAANMLSVFRNSSMAYTRQWVDAARNLKHRSQKGYKEDAIGFMTRQLQEQFGIDEAHAKKAAEAEYARAGRHDVARMLNMMFGVTVAWNLGASLPYLLIGDDDETKSEMMTDALLRGLAAGPTEGFAAGNLFSEFISRSFASEQTRKAFRNEGWGSAIDSALKQGGDYEVNPLPLMADIQGMIKKMGYDKFAAAQDVFNICAQSAVGVNPQTFTDMWNACMDYGAPGWDGTKYSADADNLAHPKEIALFIMRLMNAPTSSWRNKYIDELGMNAEDAQKLSYEEMASRYAHYKHWKDAPIMGWLRGEEGREEKIGKIRKQFDKSVQERIDRLDDEELRHNLLRSKSLEERRLLAKAVASRFGLAAGEDVKNAKEQWQQNYQQLMEYEDIREDALLSAKKKEANARGDHKTVKAINDLQSRIREKGKKKLGGDDDAELMQKIRQWRREALEKAIQAESR